VVGTSVLGVAGDGLLLVGGHDTTADGTVDVFVGSMVDGQQVSVSANFDGDLGLALFFGGVIDDEGAGLPEGNCSVKLAFELVAIDQIVASVP